MQTANGAHQSPGDSDSGHRGRRLPTSLSAAADSESSNKSDLRNHQAIVQPRLYDSLMVTQITLVTRLYDSLMVTQITLYNRGCTIA